jgi:membrane protein YqaA with SNARE-associated domain
MLHRLYRWTLSRSRGPGVVWALAVVSFAESSFFPIPPDVLLIPMALAKPDKAWLYAAICTIASVAGGVLGYAIGALLYDSVGEWLIALYGYGDRVDAFRQAYAEHGMWIILLKGLTPIPYKLITITSGFAGYNLIWFLILSIVTRGVRFYAVAGLLARFGDPLRHIFDRHLRLIASLFALGLMGGCVALKLFA